MEYVIDSKASITVFFSLTVYFLLQMEDPEVLQQNYNAVLATLALVGGVDDRPRLGGIVQHPDWGLCKIARIAINGKITVQPHDFGPRKTCRLNELEVVRSCHLF